MCDKKHLLSILFFLFTFLGIAQEAVLCSAQIDYIKIENSENIPTVTNNPDSTVTLTHQDQNITDIFADYVIYDFYQAYPNSTGVLYKYYNIVHGNKDLINVLYNTVSSDVFFIEYEYDFTPVSSNLITLLDGKVYKLIKFCSDVPEVGETCANNEQSVPEGFELKIEFNYDSNEDIIFAETINLSPCGNSFSIGFKGGIAECCYPLEIALQLWESDLGISTETNFSEPCHTIEQMLYSMLDIGCYEVNYGNIKIYAGNETGQMILERENGTFSTDFMTFQEDNLSVVENHFNLMKPFEIENNPYLQIANLNNQSVSIEIYNTSGQQIVQTKTFEENTLDISNFSSGLYFIRLSNLNNQQKIFKFLKK